MQSLLTNKMEVHQFVETFSDGDAIGYHVLSIQKFLKSKGIKSNIYANNFEPKLKSYCKKITEFANEEHAKNTKIVYHHSIYSECFNLVKNLPFKKILVYHNITPPAYFDHNSQFKHLLIKGIKQIKIAKNLFNHVIADSSFNKQNLIEFGFQKNKIKVIPPFINLSDKFGNLDKNNQKTKKRSKYIILINVSKFAPHKNQTEIIKSFFVYNKFFNSKSKLYLVGSFSPEDDYYIKIQNLITSLSLQNKVIITGKVPLVYLKRLFEESDIFISLSEHEGFGVPLVEAMYFSLPIVAYNSTAVPETLGSGGVLVNKLNPLLIAAVIDELSKNKKLQQQIIRNQKQELKRFEPLKIKKKLEKIILQG